MSKGATPRSFYVDRIGKIAGTAFFAYRDHDGEPVPKNVRFVASAGDRKAMSATVGANVSPFVVLEWLHEPSRMGGRVTVSLGQEEAEEMAEHAGKSLAKQAIMSLKDE